MLPYAGTPEFFTQDEQRNGITRTVSQVCSSARQSVASPQPLEPRPDQRPYGPLANGYSVRQSGSKDPNSACINSYNSPEQTLPGLRDILMLDSEISPRAPSSSWARIPPSPYEASYNEAVYRAPPNLQSPLALHPAHSPSNPHGPEAGLHDRRSDLSMAETQPDARFARTLFPALPHSSYHMDDNDRAEAWHELPQRVSLSSHKTVSPLEGNNYTARLSNASYERPANPQLTPVRPEAPKKYLGVKASPGKGAFHPYEDGYRIPTQVDGETVNPQWGWTKANKPRKRLALACLHCRDKKTKCEPGVNGCLQCVKAKRTCRQAPRDPSSNERKNILAMSNRSTSSPYQCQVKQFPDVDLHKLPTPRLAARKSTGLWGDGPSTRQRGQDEPLASNAFVDQDESASRIAGDGSNMISVHPPPYRPLQEQGPAVATKDHILLMPSDNVHATDPVTTMRLLDIYFSTVNNSIYCIFPRNTFMSWLTTSSEKSSDTKMVLYAMLALGSIFAGQAYAGAGERFSELALQGVSSTLGRFSLGVAQTRLLLGLYRFAKGDEGAAWDYYGLAIRAISAMRYNDEEVCVTRRDQQNQILEFGLTIQQLVECRRRTFWAVFLMDRYNGFRGGFCVIGSADVHLRLPCAEELYERGVPSEAPFFNNGSKDGPNVPLTPSTLASPMAWLIVLGGIWGNVMDFISHAKNYSRTAYREAYEKVYEEIHVALYDWSSSLPEHLRYTEANLDRSIQEWYTDTFLSLHALHHFVLMKLNRCMRHTLAPDLAPRNIRAAHHHAHTLLDIMCALQSTRRKIAHPKPGQPPHFSFYMPFPGYAILLAVDIVSAGVPKSTLGRVLEEMSGGLACLRELALSWTPAVSQTRTAEWRILELDNTLTRPYKASTSCWLGRDWGHEGLQTQEFEPLTDCVYGVHDVVYFGALQEDYGNADSSSGVPWVI